MSRTSANYVSKTYHTALKPNSCWNLRRPLALRHLSSCQWKICKNTDPTLQSRLLWNLPTCASTPAPPCKSLTWTSCTVGASTTSGTVGASATSGTVSASATSVSNISDWLTASKGGQDSSESPRFSWHGSEAFYSTRQWQLVRSPCRTGPSGSQPLFDFVSFFVFFFVLLVDVALAAVIVALQCCTSFVPYPTETGDIDSWWSSPAGKTRDSLGRFSMIFRANPGKDWQIIIPRQTNCSKAQVTVDIRSVAGSSFFPYSSLPMDWCRHTRALSKVLGSCYVMLGSHSHVRNVTFDVKCCQMIQTSKSQGEKSGQHH